MTPTDAPWDELMRSLGRFGFTEKEARLYLLIYRRGRSTARELTREAQMDRVLAYRTLDEMRARGLVQITAERPRRYVPSPPSALFERNLAERRRTLDEDSELARDLSARLPGLSESASDAVPRFQLVTGALAVYLCLRDMLSRARQSVEVLVTPRALRDSTKAGLYDALSPSFVHQGRFRLVVETELHVNQLVRRLGQSRRRFPNVEVRTVPSQRGRTTTVDGREAMVFLVPEPQNRDIDEVAVWTDNRDFVQTEAAHFEAIWSTSTPYRFPGSRSRAQGPGRPSPRIRPTGKT